MRIGQPVWHVVTGEECTGVVTEMRTWKPVQLDHELLYLRIFWMPNCGFQHEDDDDWFDAEYIRKVGEPE